MIVALSAVWLACKRQTRILFQSGLHVAELGMNDCGRDRRDKSRLTLLRQLVEKRLRFVASPQRPRRRRQPRGGDDVDKETDGMGV